MILNSRHKSFSKTGMFFKPLTNVNTKHTAKNNIGVDNAE